MYTVYKITNSVNQKTYIGVHKTSNPNDSYYGSGLAIRAAIKKYGKENFTKDILLLTESKDEAYSEEKRLTVNYSNNSTYNMRRGGIGGFTKEAAKAGYIVSVAKFTKNQRSLNGMKGYVKSRLGLDHAANGKKGGMANRGKPKSEEHKKNLRETWKRKRLSASSSIGGTSIS